MDCNKTNCMECKFGGQSDGCKFDEESYNQALEDLKNNILKGIKEDKDFASMQIKDANWEEYIQVFAK